MPDPGDPHDAVAELRGLLRETIEVARDAAHALDHNAMALEIVKGHLGSINVEERRKNDLLQRQLELEEKRLALEDRRRHETSDERRTQIGERARWQTAAIEAGHKAGEQLCKILDSRWSTLGMLGLMMLQWLWWSLGWLPGQHPPLPGLPAIEGRAEDHGAAPLPTTTEPVHDPLKEPTP